MDHPATKPRRRPSRAIRRAKGTVIATLPTCIMAAATPASVSLSVISLASTAAAANPEAMAAEVGTTEAISVRDAR